MKCITDKQRMDWMERNLSFEAHWTRFLGTDLHSPYCWNTRLGQWFRGDSVRDAIDAAMNAERKERK